MLFANPEDVEAKVYNNSKVFLYTICFDKKPVLIVLRFDDGLTINASPEHICLTYFSESFIQIQDGNFTWDKDNQKPTLSK